MERPEDMNKSEKIRKGDDERSRWAMDYSSVRIWLQLATVQLQDLLLNSN